jgi:putative MATE family efflux protein
MNESSASAADGARASSGAAERGRARIRRLLEAPIGPTLIALSIPNIAVSAATVLVAIADAWFVGRLGVAPLAALALVFPVQMLMGMMSAGAMGGGVASAIARALGAGARDRAEALVLHALLIALGMAAVYTLLFGVFARPVFAWFGGRGETLDGAVAYAAVLFGGAAAVWLANTLAAILRGTGNMTVPAWILIVTSVLEVPLSGALTLGWGGLPSIGVAGPAAAAVITFAIAAAVMLVYVAGGRTGLRLRFRGVALRGPFFYEIMKVGVIACGNALLTISTIIVVTVLVSRYGTSPLAGYGLGSRLELMLIPIAFGVGGAMTAMVGVNRGARQAERARRIAWTGGLAVFAVTTALGVAVALVPSLWIGLFTAEPGAVAFAERYLRIAGPFYGFFGMGMALYFATQGTGDMTWPFVAGTIRILAAAGLGALASLAWGAGIEWLFASVAAGLVLFGGLIALSLFSRVWR